MPPYSILISMILWILPVFKNYKCKYFYFFLFVAIQDPGNFFLVEILRFNALYWILICSSLTIVFLSVTKPQQRILGLILLLLLVIVSSNFIAANIISMIMDTIVLSILIKDLFVEVSEKREFNLFILFLAMYVLLLLIKSIYMANVRFSNEIYNYFTLVFMYLFAIFFSLFNEKSKCLIIDVRKFLFSKK